MVYPQSTLKFELDVFVINLNYVVTTFTDRMINEWIKILNFFMNEQVDWANKILQLQYESGQ